MATLKSSKITSNTSIFSSYSSHKRGIVKSTLNVPHRNTNVLLPLDHQFDLHKKYTDQHNTINTNTFNKNETNEADSLVIEKLYIILEAVADRVEMHKNIKDQRENWNSLLLTSINAITLTAATMAGVAAVTSGAPMTAMKLSSTSMYVAVTGMLTIMNKIQPSQLAEEQRNAMMLFKQLENEILTMISIGSPTVLDVEEMMERILAIDKAYPLPLLGVMLEKFPKNVEPAVWWPEHKRSKQRKGNKGWNKKLEEEMRDIVKVMRTRDKEEYLRLGQKALKLNKIMAITGPVLTGLAAIGSAFIGDDSGWGVMAAVTGGALASIVNALEHGGQVGMVFEMYRNNAGFFEMMEETIASNLRDEESERRENGEVFEMKVGLQLGRSLSELRELAVAAAVNGGDVAEFASKLF